MDAGVTVSGQPYLVLEYVEGHAIDVFCNSRSLDVAARVGLFLDVLAAVAHAHANLIVHRDIKPSNVLVTSSGEVKLLDFGIAKFLTRDPGDEVYSAPTRVEEVVLTPAYAAPEQMLGEPQSTATDVYQLGVLLYALLTGHLPFEQVGNSRAERIKAALDAEAPRPSEVAPAEWRKLLRGDLDAIVGKALRRRPEERYDSASALSTDLQRFLAHETVGARDGALAYRIRKFLRRYRPAVLGTVAAALALIVLTLFAVIQMREAQGQRDRARFQQKRAEAESQFMTLMMSAVGSADQAVTPAQILANGMELLERQYAGDPQFQVAMLVRVAARLMDLGATQQQYDALLKAEKLARPLHDPGSLASIECDIVDPEITLGHPDRAAARLDRGQKLLAEAGSSSVEVRVHCLDAEASLLDAQGNEQGAIEEDEQAVAALERAGATYDIYYGDVLVHLALLHWNGGDVKKAYQLHLLYRENLQRNGLEATQSGLADEHSLAADLLEFGEVRSAFEGEQAVLARARNVSADGSVIPPITTMLGLLQLRMGQPAAALDSYSASLSRARHTGDLPSELYALIGHARALLAQGRVAEAEADLADVNRLAAGRETALRKPLVRARITAAEALMARGRLPEARREIEAALSKLRGTTNTHEALYLGGALLIASRIAAGQTRYTDAEAAATEALQLFEQRARNPELSADVGEALLILAQDRRVQGDSDGARRFAGRAVACLTAGLGAEHVKTREAAKML
jgi:tetratricopeptide (TPR) repeat protein